MNPVAELFDGLGLTNALTYVALFMAASFLMIWRLEALLKHGLDGTALGTLVMPYCSGLGNLLLVAIVVTRGGKSEDILTNCIVNNVTNLTLILGVPALLWGLSLRSPAKAPKRKARGRNDEAVVTQQLNRLSLLLSLTAVLFFGGVTWALGGDGVLDQHDGLVLCGVFLFWQCFQVFDVLKRNVRERRAFKVGFYIDLAIVLVGAYALYVSIDWLVTWLSSQKTGFISAANLGWLSGWLMVLPNGLLACFYAIRRRADIVYSSQVGDGHICIPLCVGLAAVVHPIAVSSLFQTGLAIMLGAALVHLLCIMIASGLPRWMGVPLAISYGWFLTTGFGGL